MLYSEFVFKAFDTVVTEADNGLFYLEPMWRALLQDNELDIKNISDVKASWDDIGEVLKLEVTKRNTERSVKPYVLEWLYEIITSTIEPAMLQEETDYVKAVVDFMKENHKDLPLKDTDD